MHRRFLLHHEWPMHVEAASLGGLLLFYGFSFPVLRLYLAESPAAMIFASLGLFVSGAALYGHMAISITAKLVVDSVSAAPSEVQDGPRFGPAEALERQKDFEGAYAEYLVLARMYPREIPVRLRLADTARKLGKHAESVDLFERVLTAKLSREQAAMATARIAEQAERALNDPDRARRAVQLYLESHPTAPDRESFVARLAAIGREAPEEVGLSLVKMELEQPVVETVQPAVERESSPLLSMGLDRMTDAEEDKKEKI